MLAEAALRGHCAFARTIVDGAVNPPWRQFAAQLRAFLASNSSSRQKRSAATRLPLWQAHHATLWASRRREYSGLSIGHQIGIGAARDGLLRTDDWLKGVQMRLNEMKEDPGLRPARNAISQIEQIVRASRTLFADALQTAGVEVYREPLLKANDLWTECAQEWGRGTGFKSRVHKQIADWFREHNRLQDQLEAVIEVLWEEKVLQPIRGSSYDRARGLREIYARRRRSQEKPSQEKLAIAD